MICRVVRLGTAGGITQVVRQLAAERMLHDRFLEATDSGIELLDGQGPLPHKLIENLRGNRGSGASGARLLRFRGGIGSPHAMPHRIPDTLGKIRVNPCPSVARFYPCVNPCSSVARFYPCQSVFMRGPFCPCQSVSIRGPFYPCQSVSIRGPFYPCQPVFIRGPFLSVSIRVHPWPVLSVSIRGPDASVAQ